MYDVFFDGLRCLRAVCGLLALGLSLATGAAWWAQAEENSPFPSGQSPGSSMSLGLMVALTMRANATMEAVKVESGLPTPSLAADGKSKTCPSGFRYSARKETCHKLYCARGKIWRRTANRCESLRSPSIADNDLFLEGAWFSLIGRHREALALFGRLWDRDHPQVMSAMGYSSLRQGRAAWGMGYLARAVSLDPGSLEARARLGQAYLRLHMVKRAKAEHDEIARRGGKQCKEYLTLAAIIDRSQAARTASVQERTGGLTVAARKSGL